MNQDVLIEIEKLRRAGLIDLRKRYRELFGEETECRHREHLFRRVAWRLQALAEGDLSERARQRATNIARDADLRINAPQNFFTVQNAPVRMAPMGPPDARPTCDYPFPAPCSGAIASNERLSSKFSPKGSAMTANTIHL